MGMSQNEGPEYGPQIIGLSLERHLQKGPPIYGNCHISIPSLAEVYVTIASFYPWDQNLG